MNGLRKDMGEGLRTIDLFAGVGGIRLGFENAGFNTVFANDANKYCKETYDSNFDNPRLIIKDIWEVDIEDIPEFDILVGGFPCQAFSIAGYRQGFEDERVGGNLFFRIAEIIEKRKPKAFLLENVKNLKSHDKGKTFKIIIKTLEELGYHLKYEVLNGMDYGNIPQNRERIFIVGFLDKSKADSFNFPEKIELSRSFKEFLEGQPSGKYYYNDKPLYPKIKDKISSKDSVYQWRRKYVRENKKGVVPTLTANMGRGGHNVPIIRDRNGIRKLTPKECFLIQGFPKDYKLPRISDSELYHQAGNSVVVPVVQRIAEKMYLVLKE